MKIKKTLLLAVTTKPIIVRTFYCSIWIGGLAIMPKYGRKSFTRNYLFLFMQWGKVHIRSISSAFSARDHQGYWDLSIDPRVFPGGNGHHRSRNGTVFADSSSTNKIAGLQPFLPEARGLATANVCDGMWWPCEGTKPCLFPGYGWELLWGCDAEGGSGPKWLLASYTFHIDKMVFPK